MKITEIIFGDHEHGDERHVRWRACLQAGWDKLDSSRDAEVIGVGKRDEIASGRGEKQ